MCLCVSPTVYHGGGQAAPLHPRPRFLEGVLRLTSRLCPRQLRWGQGPTLAWCVRVLASLPLQKGMSWNYLLLSFPCLDS